MPNHQMMVDTLHPMLVNVRGQIRRSRDCHKGTDAIKAGEPSFSTHAVGTDEEYLPKLGGQDNGEYNQYKTRAVFYGAMSRTVTALVGAIDRKPPQIDGAESLEEWMKDVTGTGVSLEEFLKEVETEVMISGRCIVCVDRQNSETNRPYLVYYKSEDCVNWFTTSTTEFDQRLSTMIFREAYYDIDEENPYQQVLKYKYREFKMAEEGQVVVNVWYPIVRSTETLTSRFGDGPDELRGEKPQYEIQETYPLTNRGRALGFLPCVPIVSDGSPFDLPRPPLLDLVDINLAHYRNSADYEHGLHWTALPTPYFTGLSDRGSAITVGSGSAIVLPEANSKAGFMEFSGAGLGKIKEAMDHKETLMSALGARMLASRMDQSTSAEVARINVSGEVAALSNVAKSISRGISRLLRMVALWENKANVENIQVQLNEDYVDAKLAAPDITALVAAYQGGVLSLDSLIWNLSQGERLPMGRTVEEEIALIDQDIDKEAELALGFEEDGIAFQGSMFSSAPASKNRDESHEQGMKHAEENQKEMKKDKANERKNGGKDKPPGGK